MCNSLNATRSPLPIADFYPTLSADIDRSPIRIHGSIDPEGGLRASVSPSDGLRLHLDGHTRYCLSPQVAPDTLFDDETLASWPLPRREGETARQGLLRLLRTRPQAIDRSDAGRFLCTLYLWAQEIAYEFDLRGGLILHVDPAWRAALDDADCRDAILRFACAVKHRVAVELRLNTMLS